MEFGMHWFPERQGGLDRVYYELSRTLPEAGIEFHGLIAGTDRCAVDTGGAVLAFSQTNVGLIKRWLGMRRAFRKYLKTQTPDLLVSHFALYTLPILNRFGDRKMVLHFHGPWADEGSVEGNTGLRHLVKRWAENLVYKRATRAIVLSNAFSHLLAERYGFPKERIHVIPGGIDAKRFAVSESREAARARLGWAGGRPTIVAVRRLVPRMGLENLLTAVKIVKREIPDIQLKIAGRGILQPQLAAQIKRLSLEDNVSLVGFVSDEDLPYFYRAADLSVVPTVALEGFGLIAVESLAAGTPCLVSPIGGLPEVVSGLSCNLVLNSPSVADIAEAVCAAHQGRLSLPDDASCRAYAAQHFDWQIIAAQVADVYRLAIQ
jgi:glycosyltransferase involved in cell wall biosynthesis